MHWVDGWIDREEVYERLAIDQEPEMTNVAAEAFFGEA